VTGIQHEKVVTKPHDSRYEVSTNEWNAEHTIGDIDIPADKFLKIGKDSDGSLPIADSSYRSKLIMVEGGVGVADKIYQCLKSATDTYSWVQIATG
jgi:hypothetical protein